MFDKRSWFVSACALLFCVNEARGEPELPTAKATRSELIREAVEQEPGDARGERIGRRPPSCGAKAHRAALPDPELMLEVWQVPITRPYAVNDAGMVMVGVKQADARPGVAVAARGRDRSRAARMARAERDEAARQA
jgi:hypothetical protein